MEFKIWKEYFRHNQNHFANIDFIGHDCLSMEERSVISSSLQQFQKGESSEGRHLFAFAKQFEDPEYLNASGYLSGKNRNTHLSLQHLCINTTSRSLKVIGLTAFFGGSEKQEAFTIQWAFY